MSLETLYVSAGPTRVGVVPARGAIVSALSVDDRDLLYMDATTLADPQKNVRGGVPVLFPFAGKLADDLLLPSGTRMKQHGFGRNLAWDVVTHAADAIVLRIVSDDATRAVYPWSFVVEQRVQALARGARIELTMTNRGTTPMPVAPGWHPYFACATDAKARFHADVAGLGVGVVDDTREYDFGVSAPPRGAANLSLGATVVRLSASDALRHLQVWTLPGKPFVCVEPFWGPAGTINGPLRGEVAPGETRRVWMQAELASTQTVG